jgi:hypothetical protein
MVMAQRRKREVAKCEWQSNVYFTFSIQILTKRYRFMELGME